MDLQALDLHEIPTDFPFPAALEIGVFAIDQGNRTLAGAFGCLAEVVNEVIRRLGAEGTADDPAAYIRKTIGVIGTVRIQRGVTQQIAQGIEDLGGVPFPMPQVLQEAVDALVGPEEADVEEDLDEEEVIAEAEQEVA